MQTFLTITKALGDETRARVVMALRERELCLCQLIDLLGLAPSTVSKHMAMLQQAGLVERRKDGRWHFYRLRRGAPGADAVLAWTIEQLRETPTVVADAERLQEVCTKDLDELSACYRS